MLVEESYGKLLMQIEPAVVESEADYDRLAAEIEKLTDLEQEEGQVEPGRERMIKLLSGGHVPCAIRVGGSMYP